MISFRDANVIVRNLSLAFTGLAVSTIALAANPGQAITPAIQVIPDLSAFIFPGYGSVASDNAGNSVVLWSSASFGSGTQFARLFNTDGTPRSGQLSIDPATASANPREPTRIPTAVSMDSGGDFVVAWVSNDPQVPSAPLQDSIYIKIFNPDGTPKGDRITVGVTPPLSAPVDFSQVYAPAVAMGPDGTIVVAWVSGETFGGRRETYAGTVVSRVILHGRRYDVTGTPLGGDEIIDQASTLSFIDTYVRVAAGSDGSFAVAYRKGVALGEQRPFFARFYRANGQLAARPVRLESGLTLPVTSRWEIAASIVANGDLVLGWSATDNKDYRKATVEKVYMRRYSPAGIPRTLLPVTVATRAPSAQLRNQASISLAALPSGGNVITWPDVTGPNRGAYGRFYAADSSPLGDAFTIGTSSTVGNGSAAGIPYLTATTDAAGNVLTAYGTVFLQIFQGP